MSIVRFENVTKQFSEDAYGVQEINFSISPGEFLFVTGPSGSGKTTLMRLLLKEYTYNDGEIYFYDQALSDIKPRKVHLHRRRIGVVFQDYKLIPEMNIWENVALPLSVSGKSNEEIERRVTDLLNLIRLPEKALQFPSQLSGGEAQRVGIARALAVGPEVVIADEPTGNLDPDTAQSIARLLKKINELGTTVIVATHDKNILSTYPDTRKLSLENGRLVKDTHAKSPVKVEVKVIEIETSGEDKPEENEKKHVPEKKAKPEETAKKSTAEAADENEEHKAHETAKSKPDSDSNVSSETNESKLDEPQPTTKFSSSKKSWWGRIFSKEPKPETETTSTTDFAEFSLDDKKEAETDKKTETDKKVSEENEGNKKESPKKSTAKETINHPKPDKKKAKPKEPSKKPAPDKKDAQDTK